MNRSLQLPIPLTLFFFLSVCLTLSAQNTQIDNDKGCINCPTGVPDASAVLDIQSTDKGVLVPRMTTAQRMAIASPATGLLVFDNTTAGFWFYDGAAWQDLSTGGFADTDQQTLSFVGSILKLSEGATGGGGSVDMAPYIDNTDEQILDFDSTSNELSISNGNLVDLTPMINKEPDYLSYYDYSCPLSPIFQIDTDDGSATNCGILYDSGGPSGNYGNNEMDTFIIYDNSDAIYTRVILHSLSVQDGVDSLFIGEHVFTTDVISPDTFLFSGDDNISVRFRSSLFIVGAGFHISWERLLYQGGQSINPNLMGFFYDAEKRALGGGFEIDSSWSKIGRKAVSFGYGNKSEGQGSTSIGYQNSSSSSFGISLGTGNRATGTGSSSIGAFNKSEALGSHAFGYSNEVTGSISHAFGFSNSVTGGYSSSFGFTNDVSGLSSTVFGTGLRCPVATVTVVGRYNSTIVGSSSSWVPTDPSFVIGNGEGVSSRSTAVTILKNGNMGIGTTSPAQLLEVNGNILTDNSGDFYTDGTNGVINAGGGVMSSIVNVISDAPLPTLNNVDGDEDLYIQGDLELGSEGYKPGGGTWATASDARLKKDVHPYTDGLSQLLQVEPVRFRYNDIPGFLDKEKEYVGIIAQDMLKVAPYMVEEQPFGRLVKENEDGTETVVQPGTPYYTYNGTALTYMTVNAVKEVYESTNQRISDLERENRALKERLEKLEAIVLELGQ